MEPSRIELIKAFIEPLEWIGNEGKGSDGLYRSYLVDGKPHIGVGHLLLSSELSMVLSRQGVYDLFHADIVKRINQIEYAYPNLLARLSDNQLQSVFSWFYNTGSINSDFWGHLMDWLDGKTGELEYFWNNFYLQGGLLTERRMKEFENFLKSQDVENNSNYLILIVLAILLLWKKIIKGSGINKI